MNFIKKIWKEVSVFGLVFIVFIALLAYRQATHVEITAITQDKLEEKIENKDNFVVVIGSDSDYTTLSYKETCLNYLKKNHGDTIYYVDLANEENTTTYIQDTFDTDDGSIPSTFVIEKGKVVKQKTGSLSYYRIAELFK